MLKLSNLQNFELENIYLATNIKPTYNRTKLYTHIILFYKNKIRKKNVGLSFQVKYQYIFFTIQYIKNLN
jgi:hypothetical protein